MIEVEGGDVSMLCIRESFIADGSGWACVNAVRESYIVDGRLW